MPLYRIDRVKRGGKPLRAPELMHSNIAAANAAEALAAFREQYPGFQLDELVARPWPERRGAA